MTRLLRARLDSHAQRLDHAALQLARPAHVLLRHSLTLRHLDDRRCAALATALRHAQRSPLLLSQQLQRAAGGHFLRAHARLDALGQRLAALDPKRVLSRGYAWVTDAHGQPLVSVRGLKAGQAVQAVWSDGRADALITEVRPDT